MKDILLPDPQREMDFPLMKAFALRRTRRKFLADVLPLQELSNLLWAACGQTMAAGKRNKSKRTVPSACNAQEIRVYVVLKEGAFLYNEVAHCLTCIADQDIRFAIGRQKMMCSAPVGLIYVSDYSRLSPFYMKNDEDRMLTSAVDTGFVAQNVYLYCAAAGLNTAFLALIDRGLLHKLLAIPDHEHIMYTQVLGKAF